MTRFLALLAAVAVAVGCGGGEPARPSDGGADGPGAVPDGSTLIDGVPLLEGGVLPGDGGTPDGPSAPGVRLLSPISGATVGNPVLFKIEAHGVEQVEILADQTYSLGSPWDPAQRSTLLYRFGGTGVPRPIHLSGRVGGQEVASDDITITVQPDPCEDRFFVSKFDANNKDPSGTLDLVAIREESLAAVRQAVADLQACGATVTLGGMMSLLYYEGAFHVAAYNTLCEQNSYNKTATDCDVVAEALYSYQFGLGGMHTSNFHPCKGGSYTQGMRQRFLQEAAKAGFSTDVSLIPPGSALATRFKEVCPQATPTAVDYYLLGAHDVFGVPKDDEGNYLAGYGKFPLFHPAVSVSLTFAEISGACSQIDGDRDAITLFGGSDTSYGSTSKQNTILAYYDGYQAANCP
jgi:hypothetical protein